jgi:AcrR family transcriptional regulator
MSRTVDERRRGELRHAILRYLIKHGLTQLSLRPLAKALGCSPRILLYHFGSKEKMIIEILAQVRQQQRAIFEHIPASSLTEAYRLIWKRMSAPDSEPLFRLFFEAYGMALRYPRLYQDFLHGTIETWLQLTAEDLRREGVSRNESRAIASIVLDGLRGFMLDFCTTKDRKRLDRAVTLWLRGVEATLATHKEVHS